uniref:Ig-like domain-containing protein n=1 Tax=Amphiprion ocellaris TaxID=80972 RepID=A0A3Q1CWS0_AMPOC
PRLLLSWTAPSPEINSFLTLHFQKCCTDPFLILKCAVLNVLTVDMKTGQAAVLHCTMSDPCSAGGFLYQWFAFNQSGHFRLDLTGDKYNLDGASLHIKSLQANDSGIYHCAVASQGPETCCRQYVGMGTSLMVRGEEDTLTPTLTLP